MNMRNIYIVLTLLLAAVQASAQKFYNLTAKEVRVDSVLPIFSHTESLPVNFRDSVYSFSIAYAEYADMPRADIEAYQRIEPNLPAAQPRLETSVVMDRKQPSLLTTFCPVVMREGRWQVLVSFMLRRSATPVRSANIISDNETGNIVNLKTGNVAERISRLNSITRMGEALHADAVAPQDRYARHSVLRSGRWVKIRVPSTGVYQLTTELMRKAGFSNPDRVKVYGYGGNLQSETLDSDYLIATDDLHEVPTCTIGSRRLIFRLWLLFLDRRRHRTAKIRFRRFCFYILSVGRLLSRPIRSGRFQLASWRPELVRFAPGAVGRLARSDLRSPRKGFDGTPDGKCYIGGKHLCRGKIERSSARYAQYNSK